MTENVLELKNLTMSYGDHEILHSINLEVKRGEIMIIVGPSGAGKSTLLRIADGLESAKSGDVFLFGEKLTRGNQKSLRGRAGILFQKSVLFDRSVFENIALGLSYRHVSKTEQNKRVSEILKDMGLESYANRHAVTLSGGEGQRVSLARVLVTRPELIFMDEPTANLDPLTTKVIEEMIIRENHDNKTTVIINTHDREQAQRLADRVAVLISGRLTQVGTADDVWYRPIDSETAHFIGFQNIIPVKIRNGSALANGKILASTELKDGEAVFMIRAEDVHISVSEIEGSISAAVTSLERRGAFLEILADAGISVNMPYNLFNQEFSVGSRVYLSWKKGSAVIRNI